MVARVNLVRLLLLAAAVILSVGVSGGESRPAFACGGGSPASGLPFCEKELPIQTRVKDLVGRLTVVEKVGLLVNKAAAVPRLGIGPYEWWSEALHGLSYKGRGVRFGGDFPAATSFPQVISTAASLNVTLWEMIGKAVSDEARAMYNGGQAGLSYWSPNVNVFRDPRWGRGQETPGEDPLLAGRFGAAYVRGLQQLYAGNRLKVAACCKHFTAYDLDNWEGYNRYTFNAKVSKQDLEDTFNVPFKTCVTEGEVASIMCSYNQVNGVPSCADTDYLRGVIGDQWHLSGYIVADCDSVGVFFSQQNYTKTPEDAAAIAIKAGLDLDCGTFLAKHTEGALAQGKLTVADIDSAVTNTITVQMRLGMFDGDEQPFGDLGPRDVCTPAHQDLALEAARQGIVLLKNERGALPLAQSKLGTVAVVGPNSDANVTMLGNYPGIPCGYTSPLQGIERYVKSDHQLGCADIGCQGNQQPIDAAVDAARRSDATIVVVGLDQSFEREKLDRLELLLPGRQQELVTKVAAASKGPVVLVLMCGGPVDISFAKNDPKIHAILWVGYPGQSGGHAIADIVFGAFNPGGKLPVTWYPQEYLGKAPMTDMAMRPDPARGYPGRTYRFYTGPVVYPFGHGLSYSKFVHAIVAAPSELVLTLDGPRNSTRSSGATVRVAHARCDELSVTVHVDVMNVGDRDGSHSLLVYSAPPQQSRWAPRRQLVAFEKVHVAAGEQARVKLGIDVCRDLSFADVHGIRRIQVGDHSLQIDDLSHSISLRV